MSRNHNQATATIDKFNGFLVQLLQEDGSVTKRDPLPQVTKLGFLFLKYGTDRALNAPANQTNPFIWVGFLLSLFFYTLDGLGQRDAYDR